MGASSKLLLSPRTERVAFALAVLGLFALIAALVLYEPQDPSVKGDPIGSIVTEGQVRRRHGRSLLWQDLKQTQTLYQLDFVYVPPGNLAKVTLKNGTAIDLPAGTMVQFDALDDANFEINLIAGKLKDGEGFNLKKKKEFFVRWKSTRLLEYLPSLEPDALKQEEFVDRLTNYLNRPARSTRFREPDFQPFTLTKIDQFELNLVEPRDKEVVRSAKGEWVDAIWSPIPLKDIAYEVQVSQRKEFDYYVSYRTTFNAISLQVEDSGIYYWRVIATQGKTGELISSPAMFTYEVTSRKLNPLLGRLPAATQSLYVTEISKSENFASILVRQNTNSKKCVTAGLKAGEYFCRVRRTSNDEVLSVYPFSAK